MPTPISRQMPSTSFYESALWDPKSVLQIQDDCRCVGWAPSKRRKCLNPIAQGSLIKVNTLLDKISKAQPDADLVHSELVCLAQYALCVRFHQGQVRDMVQKWKDRIVGTYPDGIVLPPQTRPTSPRPPTYTSCVDRTSPALMHSRVASIPRRTGEAQSEIESLLQTIHDALGRLTELGYASSTTSLTPSRTPTSEISSLHLSRSSTNQSSLTPSITSSSPRSSGTAAQRTSPTARSPPAVNTRCRLAHASRRPFAEECPICQQDGLMSNQALSALVWCKSGCGRSVHKECFEGWLAECVSGGRSVRCIFCRASWNGTECECNS